MENTDKLKRLGIKTISQFGERYRDFLDSLEEKVFGEYVGYKLNLSQNELIYIQEKSMKTIKLYDYSQFPMNGTWAIVKDSSIHYEKGGGIEENENALMVSNNNKQIAHHTKELEEALKNNEHVPAWVVAKVNRSASDLSDATHYLDGTSKMETGGKIKNQYENMSPSQIWSSWNYNQRLHFLEDHIHLSSKDKTYYADLDYSDLTETIQYVIHVHTKSGQYAKGGGVKIMPQQGTLLTKDKKLKLDYKKVGNNYEFVVYEGENNPVANYTKTSFKKKQNGIVTMDYNQFINYLYSEGYIDDKNYALGGSTPSQRKKVAKVMREWKEGELHSGSKKGPIVKDQKQAVAIALSEAGLSKKETGVKMLGWKHKNK